MVDTNTSFSIPIPGTPSFNIRQILTDLRSGDPDKLRQLGDMTQTTARLMNQALSAEVKMGVPFHSDNGLIGLMRQGIVRKQINDADSGVEQGQWTQVREQSMKTLIQPGGPIDAILDGPSEQMVKSAQFDDGRSGLIVEQPRSGVKMIADDSGRLIYAAEIHKPVLRRPSRTTIIENGQRVEAAL